MNVVKEINRINDIELKLGASGASWHDEYKDSAYIFVGGLNFEMSEGDVITVFSQYGEVMNVNMPRDKETGKPRGFAFLMYEDQRSTVLAVDNLNGAKVLDRVLKVDHVKNYKQPKMKGENGEWIEPDEQEFNAKPEMVMDVDNGSESPASSYADIDPEDPMRDYLIAKRKEEKALNKSKKSKSKRKDETPEERRARKEKKREKKAKKIKSAARGVEDLLKSLDKRGERDNDGNPGRRRRLDNNDDRSRSPDTRKRKPRSYSISPSREDRSSPGRSETHSGKNFRHMESSSGKVGPHSRDTGSRRTRDYD